jgi:hypothetical protein
MTAAARRPASGTKVPQPKRLRRRFWTLRYRRVGTRRSGSDMRFEEYSFGSIQIDGVSYDHDLVVDRGKIRKRKKAASKRFRDAYGHTPLSLVEEIPWRCRRLVIGTGAHGSLPVMREVEEEARRRNVDLLIAPTADAIETLNESTKSTNAVLHVTC